MAGDAKRNGGRFGMGKWFSSTKPAALDSTTPSAPPGTSSPYPPSHPGNNPYINHSPEGSFTSGAPSNPPSHGPNNPYLNYPPQGSGGYPDQIYPPAQPASLGGAAHGLGHPFHQNADPTGPYTTGQPPYPPQEWSGAFQTFAFHLVKPKL